MTRTLSLADDRWRVVIAPDPGACLVEAAAHIDGRFIALTRPTPPYAARSSNFASFLLAPYSNRIRDGRFSFGGRTHQLRYPEKHAIHGDVRDRPWRVTETSGTAAELEWDSRWWTDVNFPYPFAARVVHACVDGAYVTELSLTNVGVESMPAGGGFHPYFRRDPLGIGDGACLSFSAGGVYPTGALPIPTGAAAAIPQELDFGRSRDLPFALDHVYAGWSGLASITWPKSRIRLEIKSPPPLGHLVVFSPAGRDFFAVEPVSHATDAFNLADRGVEETGMFVILPGEKRTFRMEWRLYQSM